MRHHFILLIITQLLNASFFGQDKLTEKAFYSYISQIDTIQWLGADFSNFRLSNPEKVGEDIETFQYIDHWNSIYNRAIPNVKIASIFGFSKAIDQSNITDSNYFYKLPENWIIKEPYLLEENAIKITIDSYKIEDTSKVCFVYILENFLKSEAKVSGYFVWFEPKTRDILYSTRVIGDAKTRFIGMEYININERSFGMIGYWYQGMADATIEQSINHKISVKKVTNH